MDFLRKLLGPNNDKEIKVLSKTADLIEALEPSMQALTDVQLRAKTDEFKQRLADGETLNELLPEAFAVVREAAVRTLGQRQFKVQLIGGIVLHQGRIAEMKTGEGKTLVSTLPAYLNALVGKGVHIVTVNDYLARFHSEWMGKVHRFLGLSVGLILHDMDTDERQIAYNSDITYATNNELGFDYLRDNMVIYRQEMVQRDLYYGIVDEVDSILIDEARTPLIISGAGDKSTDMYTRADRFGLRLKKDEDFALDEKAHTVNLTEEGVTKTEQFFNVTNLSDIENTELYHHVNQALKAHALMKRDRDYVVQDGEVVIVDEFTGRLMTGRRYSDGLHQAIEAKENVKVERESKTLATITFQNYFRMYSKLSGMTGTAKTEEDEFKGIYNLDVVVIPTNMKMIRKDLNDIIYLNENGKYQAVIEEVVLRHSVGQPVLVGTVSVEKSEVLSHLLKLRGVPHEVLNAKFHQKEAEIIAQAGKLGAVTIATNMAGRGTDILLGGNAEFIVKREMRKKDYPDHIIEEATGHNETDDADILDARDIFQQFYSKYKKIIEDEHIKVVEVGGLHIIGTERHESRRIDNQLRGRSGRQGDPGSSRFYISLTDDLMRLFGSDRIAGIVGKLGLEEDQPIEYGMLSRQIEAAQKKVESKNFDIRKHVLQYDDVMNLQRDVIYSQRRKVLVGEDVHQPILDMVHGVIESSVALYTANANHPEEWDLTGLFEHLEKNFLPENALAYSQEDLYNMTKEELIEDIYTVALQQYEEKEKDIAESGADMREVERVVLLRIVDAKWTDHIDAMDDLREGIGLRAYGQRDPVVEYKFEGYEMFEEMSRNIQDETVTLLYHVNVERMPERQKVAQTISASHGEEEKKKPEIVGEKIGRNSPCPCGSGKKYKSCCGNL